MSLTIEAVGRRTLGEIACDIGLPLVRWRHDCGLIAPAIARAYELDVRLLQLANDGTGDQRYHVMLITADDRVLDALECQARQGRDPVDCSDWLPFVGQRAIWGQARGFDAQGGSITDVPRRPWWAA
jgi:hypothetical protein